MLVGPSAATPVLRVWWAGKEVQVLSQRSVSVLPVEARGMSPARGLTVLRRGALGGVGCGQENGGWKEALRVTLALCVEC